jgi:hypothetical protein
VVRTTCSSLVSKGPEGHVRVTVRLIDGVGVRRMTDLTAKRLDRLRPAQRRAPLPQHTYLPVAGIYVVSPMRAAWLRNTMGRSETP